MIRRNKKMFLINSGRKDIEQALNPLKEKKVL
jgi:hypothetical protein